MLSRLPTGTVIEAPDKRPLPATVTFARPPLAAETEMSDPVAVSQTVWVSIVPPILSHTPSRSSITPRSPCRLVGAATANEARMRVDSVANFIVNLVDGVVMYLWCEVV